MTRLPLWNVLLAEFIHGRLMTPFVWGENDCCLFACDAVLAMTGVDLAAQFRGKYYSEETAKQIIHAYAGGGLREFVAKVAVEHGIAEVGLNYATAGDVVIVDGGSIGDTLGIVELNGREVMVAGIPRLLRVPRSHWLNGWKI